MHQLFYGLGANKKSNTRRKGFNQQIHMSCAEIWYSNGFSVSFIPIQIWSITINSSVTQSQGEFGQANSGAEIMKDLGIWPVIPWIKPLKGQIPHSALSGLGYEVWPMSKPRFESGEIQKDESRDWSVFHWTWVNLGQRDVTKSYFMCTRVLLPSQS